MLDSSVSNVFIVPSGATMPEQHSAMKGNTSAVMGPLHDFKQLGNTRVFRVFSI